MAVCLYLRNNFGLTCQIVAMLASFWKLESGARMNSKLGWRPWGGASFLVDAFSIGDAVVAGLCDGWPNALSLTNSPVAMSMQPPSNGVKITFDRWPSK